MPGIVCCLEDWQDVVRLDGVGVNSL
ncbi:hypothetical protein Tco_0595337, partial [Tanacetum coccineum]